MNRAPPSLPSPPVYVFTVSRGTAIGARALVRWKIGWRKGIAISQRGSAGPAFLRDKSRAPCQLLARHGKHAPPGGGEDAPLVRRSLGGGGRAVEGESDRVHRPNARQNAEEALHDQQFPNPMTNHEIRKNTEIRMTKGRSHSCAAFDIRASDFFGHLTFVISSFNWFHRPNAKNAGLIPVIEMVSNQQ